MKKLFAYAFLFLSLAFLPGCGKEEDDPFVLENPEVEISWSNPTPDYMGTSTLTWKVTGQYFSVIVTINGQVISNQAQGDAPLNDLVQKQVALIVVKRATHDLEPISKTVSTVPKNKEEIPTISITATPDTLPYGGGRVQISWTANTNYVVYNNEALEPVGSFEAGWIYEDKTFVFFALKGLDLDTIGQITVFVSKIPPPTHD